MQKVHAVKQFDHQVGNYVEKHGGKPIPEQLHPAMQVGFRENDVARQYEPHGEADAECNDIGHYPCSNRHQRCNTEVLLMKNEIQADGIDDDV